MIALRGTFPLIFPTLALLASPGASPGQTFVEADSLLAAGDTSGALAVYERMVARDYRNAEARYRAAVLYMSRHEAGTDLSPNRRRAEEHLRIATRVEGDSAQYWLALAELFRGEDWSFTRMQVRGLVDNARAAARRTGAHHLLAPVAYRAAREEWDRYVHRARRVLFTDFAGVFDDIRFARDDTYARDFLERAVRPDPGAGQANYIQAETHLREALDADPGHVAATGLYVVLLGESARWEEALATVRRALAADSTQGAAWALLGLVYTRLDRWSEAAAAYDAALARMTTAERAPYEQLGLILRHGDRVAWEQAGRAARATFDSLYWNVADPLRLVEGNEVRVEFFARITYADHRWSDPLRGYRGWEADMGAVYVRYGPPTVWQTLARAGGGSLSGSTETPIIWLYHPSQVRFVFSLNAGFARSRFAGDAKETYRVAVQQRPMLFDNIPLVATLDTVLAQVVQFRGPAPDRTDVAIFSFIPVGRMVAETDAADVTVASGAIIQRPDGREVQRARREEVVRGRADDPTEQRTWRLRLSPDTYLLRLEAHIPQLHRGARNMGPLDVRRFGGAGLEVSDVLLARRVAPRDSAATRWSDFLIEPSAGNYAPEDPMGLLWEVYDLAADSVGVARYAVSVRLTVEEIERTGFWATIIGGIGDAVGTTAEGDDRVELIYEREVADPGPVQVEYLAVDLGNAPAGRYTVTVTIHDRVADRLASTARAFHVSGEPVAR